MAQDKISLPSSGGGLVRYSDEAKSKFMIKPQHIIAIIALVVVLEWLLHVYGNSIFGLG
ncbi:preprotein translocase subunit Sec61beta [Candidatus Woesearchaeota archaeon]|nr:preprotein translocase subunit Sec61beta [Candidatus Woesearchaeota archaeon]